MKPKEIQGNSAKDAIVSDLAEQILSVLKRGCRDPKRSVIFTSISLAFKLLEHFASARNSYASTLYKALTFIMIDSAYLRLDIRHEMLTHFGTLFQRQ